MTVVEDSGACPESRIGVRDRLDGGWNEKKMVIRGSKF
jgi:hypothetical protein